jgi:hypothetical protein
MPNHPWLGMARHDPQSFFLFYLFSSSSFFLKKKYIYIYKMGIIVFSYHFCYLFDQKHDQMSQNLKMIANMGFKFPKKETGVLMSKTQKAQRGPIKLAI